jgi:hypothetical protein
MELPHVTLSNTLNELPTRIMPYNERADPKRQKDRSEKELPQVMVSRSDREDPILQNP